MIELSRGNISTATFFDSLDSPAISVITAHELIVGARNNHDLAAIDSLVDACTVEHLDRSIGLLAYELLKRYAKSDGLRAFDSLIAATAIERGRVLISRNRKHFAMIDGLHFEQPLF